MRLLIHSEKDFLDDLLPFRSIPQEASGVVKHLVTTLSEQGVKRSGVTRL
jgi:hypothetical protein